MIKTSGTLHTKIAGTSGCSSPKITKNDRFWHIPTCKDSRSLENAFFLLLALMDTPCQPSSCEVAQETLIPDWFKFTCFHPPECTFKSTFLLAAHGEMPSVNHSLLMVSTALPTCYSFSSSSRILRRFGVAVSPMSFLNRCVTIWRCPWDMAKFSAVALESGWFLRRMSWVVLKIWNQAFARKWLSTKETDSRFKRKGKGIVRNLEIELLKQVGGIWSDSNGHQKTQTATQGR